MTSPEQIIDFWFNSQMKEHWFSSTTELDNQIRNLFEELWLTAKTGKLDLWKSSPEGCLALVILYDQIPLNMYRNDKRSFETEAVSRDIARHAIKNGFDQRLSKEQLSFLYMPFMHSENLDDQDYSVQLFEQAGLSANSKFAHHHREIVRAYGRFPHRNKILGRISTDAENEYLSSKKAFLG